MAFKDSKPSSEVAQQQKLKVLNELHHLEDACHFWIHFAREGLISDFRSRQFFNHGRFSNSKKHFTRVSESLSQMLFSFIIEILL